MIFSRFTKLLAGAIFAVAGAFITSNAYAADNEQFIQISPASQEVKLTPGEVYTGVVSVSNIGSKELSYKMSAAPYQPSSANYEDDFITENDYTQITKWITFSQESGTLAPGKSDDIVYVITVPSDASSYGQYAAIMATVVNGSSSAEGTSMNVVSRVASKLYASVGGSTTTSGQILENTPQNGYAASGTLTASSLVKNSGNTHARASYVLSVSSFFGGEELYTNEENPETHIILPNSERYNTMSYDTGSAIGIFKVKQVVTFLDTTDSKEAIVIVLPVWLLLLIIFAIVFLIVFIVLKVRSRH